MNKVYHTPLSVTSQFSFCGLPFRMDSYAGCAFNCTYCFARLRGGNSSNKIRIADANMVINRFKKSISNPQKKPSIVSEYIQRKMPVHFGGMSDPFQPIERTKKISFNILKYLCEIQYPIIISTKSTLLSCDPYLSILKTNPKILIQFSLSTTNETKALIAEPFSPSPTEILKSIEIISRNGIKTAIRWQPYIPNISESPEEFIKRVSSVGIKHLGFEHLKLSVERKNPLLIRALKMNSLDIKEHFLDKKCIQDGREYILPANEKLLTALTVRNELRKYSISFGAADNEIQYLSDTFCCCSGADQFDGFQNWNKFQIAHAVKKSNGKTITFDSIKDEWRPNGSLDMHLNSKSRIVKTSNFNTVFDYVKSRWENLNSSFNPTRFFGVRYSGKLDGNGLKLYEWTNDRVFSQFIK